MAFLLLLRPLVGFAFETDQYNLPPEPLADIGDEVSEYVEARLRTAVAGVNAEIEKSVRCLETKVKGCGSTNEERANLARLRSNGAIADQLFKLIGDGNLFTTKIGNWMRAHKFRGQPDRYKAPLRESIFILNPADYLTISATVRLFGSEFGIDKLEHFFQQGYEYYKIENKALAKGMSTSDSEKKAVGWGQMTERTYFGLLVSGVYSNADLYANYVGMKFYDGLAKPMQINGKTRPAIVELRNGSWQIDAGNSRENLLKPFLTDHMNEALNPSSFRATLVRSVRRAVKTYSCPEWKQAFPTLRAAALDDRSKALELWNGEDYGYTKRDHVVTISETCFEEPKNTPAMLR